jgi:flagellar basal body rod protein FlgF
MILPTRIDMTLNGKIVDRAEIGEKGYIENVEYELQIQFTSDGIVEINYYGEDDTYLSVKDFIKLIEINNE